MLRKTHTVAILASVLLFWAGDRAHGQENLLRIASPVNGDVVMSGQTLRISVSADESVRSVFVISGYPMPNARPLGDNQFEIVIPKTLPSGKYNLTAVGATSTPVESAQVTIQVEREDPANFLQVQPPFLVLTELGDRMSLRVTAKFEDGSQLDVTNSTKTKFEAKDPAIARIDDQGMAVCVGPGQTSIMANYPSAYGVLLIRCPRPKPTGPAPEISSAEPQTGTPGVTEITIRGQHFGESQGQGYVCIGTLNGIVKRWSDKEIVAIVPDGTHHGVIYVGQGELTSNDLKFFPIGVLIDGISGMTVPGKSIRIMGSGFEPEQGSGSVTIAGIKAEVLSWSNAELVVKVPEFAVSGWSFQISVHQNGRSSDFPIIDARKTILKQ